MDSDTIAVLIQFTATAFVLTELFGWQLLQLRRRQPIVGLHGARTVVLRPFDFLLDVLLLNWLRRPSDSGRRRALYSAACVARDYVNVAVEFRGNAAEILGRCLINLLVATSLTMCVGDSFNGEIHVSCGAFVPATVIPDVLDWRQTFNEFS